MSTKAVKTEVNEVNLPTRVQTSEQMLPVSSHEASCGSARLKQQVSIASDQRPACLGGSGIFCQDEHLLPCLLNSLDCSNAENMTKANKRQRQIKATEKKKFGRQLMDPNLDSRSKSSSVGAQ